MRGQHYICAGDRRIPNQGEQHLQAITNDFKNTLLKMQIADVNRPLKSVSDTCDAGNLVVFGPHGGSILSLTNGKVTDFERRGGLYTMDLWIPDPQNSSGFVRREA